MKSGESTSRPSRLAGRAGPQTSGRPSAHSALRHELCRPLRAIAWAGVAALLLLTCPAPSSARAEWAGDLRACVNLKEQVPKKYRGRYDKWKEAFLSADVGRQLWLRYACNPAFRLTIIVSEGLDGGGQVKLDDYRWVEGRLVAATVVLGHRLDRGYPDPREYPVLGSFIHTVAIWDIWEANVILAAAKIAHELGHVDQAAKADPTLFRLQNELSKVYISHLRSNGYHTDDPALVEMAARIGGMPMVLGKQREYWAETYALRYLLVKLSPGKQRALLKLVRKALAKGSSLYYLPSQTEWKTLASFE